MRRFPELQHNLPLRTDFWKCFPEGSKPPLITLDHNFPPKTVSLPFYQQNQARRNYFSPRKPVGSPRGGREGNLIHWGGLFAYPPSSTFLLVCPQLYHSLEAWSRSWGLRSQTFLSEEPLPTFVRTRTCLRFKHRKVLTRGWVWRAGPNTSRPLLPLRAPPPSLLYTKETKPWGLIRRLSSFLCKLSYTLRRHSAQL